MKITATETRYLAAKAALDKAKADFDKAKAELLGRRGIELGKVTKADFEGWQCETLELAALKISHFAKSATRWDGKVLTKLAERVPEVLEARSVSYRTEARITIKAAA
jgi:hypothetical protein